VVAGISPRGTITFLSEAIGISAGFSGVEVGNGKMGIKKDVLTNAQKQEVERLRNFVSRNRLTSLMNSTKWRAAIDAIQAIEGYAPSFRCKRITDALDPPEGQWDEAFPGNVPLYNSIEWLEMNPYVGSPPVAGKKDRRADFGETLKRELAAAGIPLAESGTGVRIKAYARTK